MSQPGSKPNSVSTARLRAPQMMTIPLVPPSLAGSSDLPGSFGRAVRRSRPPSRLSALRRGGLRSPIWSCSVRGFACHLPYSRCGALLPHLFTLTFRLASPRIAQGRPRNSVWSHGLALREPRRGESKGGIFSVPLVLRVAPTGSYPAQCPAEFGLSSPRLTRGESNGGHLAHCGGSRS